MNTNKNAGDSVNNIENNKLVEITNWLGEVRFRKQLFGGVNEEDVWKKIQQLDELYAEALKEERIRYDALLRQHNKPSTQILKQVDPKDR